MQYSLEISDRNRQPHIDIEEAIQKQKNGLFTFIIRLNGSNVVDFNLVYVTDSREYLILKQVTIQKLTVAYDIDPRDKQDPIRTDNG